MPMPSAETLRGLLEKVEAATGADQRLDAEILCALLAPAGSYVEQSPFNGVWCAYKPNTQPGKRPSAWETPRPWRGDRCSLTTSIDLSIALVDQAIPGANYLIARGKTRAAEPQFGCQLLFSHDHVLGEGEHDVHPALAILAALLRALLAQSGEAGR